MDRADLDAQAAALRHHIARQIGVSAEEIPDNSHWGSTGNTIGTICLRIGLLDFEQIEAIVNAQPVSGDLFGETGIRMGYLTREQLEAVLEVQRAHRYLDLGALLLMRGMVELPHFLDLVAMFIREKVGGAEGQGG